MSERSAAPNAPQEPSQAPHPVIAPPAQNATQVHVALNIHEVLLLFGKARSLVDQVTNQPMDAPGREWFISISLSPVAAKNLHAALTNAIAYYEGVYGQIPPDPDFTLREI